MLDESALLLDHCQELIVGKPVTAWWQLHTKPRFAIWLRTSTETQCCFRGSESALGTKYTEQADRAASATSRLASAGPSLPAEPSCAAAAARCQASAQSFAGEGVTVADGDLLYHTFISKVLPSPAPLGTQLRPEVAQSCKECPIVLSACRDLADENIRKVPLSSVHSQALSEARHLVLARELKIRACPP